MPCTPGGPRSCPVTPAHRRGSAPPESPRGQRGRTIARVRGQRRRGSTISPSRTPPRVGGPGAAVTGVVGAGGASPVTGGGVGPTPGPAVPLDPAAEAEPVGEPEPAGEPAPGSAVGAPRRTRTRRGPNRSPAT